MPRLLPWQTAATASSRPSTPVPPSTKKRKQPTLTDDEADLLDENLNPLQPTHNKSKDKRPVRDASSSPPPVSSVPQAECMVEGADRDDQWMMVEDEFYSTAKIYTRHIHHAEYIRKTEEAKARQNNGHTSHITDGRTQQSRSTQLSLAVNAKERKIREAMEAQNGDQSDLDDADPHLAGLMTGSRAPTLDLTGFAKVQTNTRAAAGFQQSPHRERQKKHVTAESSATPDTEDSTDDDDDLDRPAQKKIKPTRVLRISPKKQPASVKTTTKDQLVSSKAPTSGNIFKQFAKKKEVENESSVLHQRSSKAPVSSWPAQRYEAKVKADPAIKPEPMETQTASDAFIKTETTTRITESSYLARKRAEREKKRKAEEEAALQQKVKQEYEIPTFL